jgi:hypothetical protein
VGDGRTRFGFFCQRHACRKPPSGRLFFSSSKTWSHQWPRAALPCALRSPATIRHIGSRPFVEPDQKSDLFDVQLGLDARGILLRRHPQNAGNITIRIDEHPSDAGSGVRKNVRRSTGSLQAARDPRVSVLPLNHAREISLSLRPSPQKAFRCPFGTPRAALEPSAPPAPNHG